MTTPHPYAEILHAIADGKQIQFQYTPVDVWVAATYSTALSEITRSVYPANRFRIKPDTTTIGGKELNAPLRVAPEQRTRYYIPDFHEKSPTEHMWADDSSDHKWLAAGICFATEADAKAVAEAFLALLKPNTSE